MKQAQDQTKEYYNSGNTNQWKGTELCESGKKQLIMIIFVVVDDDDNVEYDRVQ